MKARKTNKKGGAILALLACGLGASCSSVIKGQSAELQRGLDDDEAKPYADLSRYVSNRELSAPAGVSQDLLVDDPDVSGRKKWQNFKNWPRNYKFSIAVAPLREDFRRKETDPENGEPQENFSTRPPDAPIEDDGLENFADPQTKKRTARKRATLPPGDALFGFEVTTNERGAAGPVTSSTEAVEPPSVIREAEQPKPPENQPKQPEAKQPEAEQPKPPEKQPEATPPANPDETLEDDGLPRPKRVGAAPLADRHYAAASSGQDIAASASGNGAPAAKTVSSDIHIREISAKEGKNFRIDSDKFQARMTQLCQEFRVFENVDPIKYGDDQKTLEGLFREADARKDDLLLVCSLRRNKVSYHGLSLGPAAADNLIEFLVLFNEFWSPIHREEYECDVELYVQLYDVRSRHLVFDQTFEGHDELVLSTAQRGWHPLRNWIWFLGDINSEGLYASVGEYVRPGAWLSMEIQLLDRLQNALKAKLDDQQFDIDTNRYHDLATGSVTKLPPRQLALVCGITEYGAQAQPRLTAWAAENEKLSEAEAQKELVKLYDGQPVQLGTRPYAEEDAKRLAKDLLSRPGALEAASGVLAANLYAKLGKDATLSELRAAFRQIARARQDDRVFVYLNGETLVLDDPAKPDGTTKYFLPYDIDLTEVERRWSQGPAAAKAYLDEHALSFDWIDSCFYRDSLADHIYLQSRHSLMVVDCAFPGQCTRARFCPKRAERARLRLIPEINGSNLMLNPANVGPRKAPEKAPEKEPEKAPVKEPEKGPEKQPEKQPEKAPEKQPEMKPADDDDGPHPARVGHFVNPSRFRPTTVLAQAAGVDSNGTAAVTTENLAQFTTTGFLERIAVGGQGRFVVLTTAPDELSLDIPAVKQGGFVYYFTQFLDPVKQARFGSYKDAKGDYLARRITEYAIDRLESESRQAGRPQHVLTFGDKEHDYVLLSSQR